MRNRESFFDERLRSKFRKKVFTVCVKLIRIFIILAITVQFFLIAIIPTPSMSPTLNPKDIVLIDAMVKESEYNRGDIVAFDSPLAEENGTIYVKRMIGLPSEEIEIRNHKIYINGEPLYEEYLAEVPYYDYPKTKIPEGHYFMLGDNRNLSYDSSSYGFVPKENLKGKVIYRIFPFDKIQKFETGVFE